MLRASMPEAAIQEHGELLLREGEVRAARDMMVPAPSGNVIRTEQLGERDFRVLVPLAPDTGHHLGALGFGEDISLGRG